MLQYDAPIRKCILVYAFQRTNFSYHRFFCYDFNQLVFWCVLYLEKLLEGWMYRGIGHKRQGVERQELSGLAQCRPSGLQIVFEMCDPVLKLSFILYYTNIFLHVTKNYLHLD